MTSICYLLLFKYSLFLLLSSNHSTIASITNQEQDDLIGDLMNDTEISTVLVDSNASRIEDYDLINSTGQDGTRDIRNARRHSRTRKHRKSSCRVFSVREKYSMLEGVGGRNQLYMAETPDEASRGFVSPRSSSSLQAKYSDSTNENNYTPYCNEECETIRTKLENVLEHRPRLWAASAPETSFNDAASTDLDEDFSTIDTCSLVAFVPVGNCTYPGREISWAHDRLCSKSIRDFSKIEIFPNIERTPMIINIDLCRGIYVLSSNCFPKFLNSVLCNQHETGCIFDNFSNRAHGTCRPETLSLWVLRNRGDAKCEDWILEQMEIPVACQCLLSKESWLRPTPLEKL
ncbi:hypothetical protein DICVIV_03904 [Dictyocaulus viviparus]|uniref:Uncharacterized protein n=1 Tax=Dictyocaulus viviparus TaxID=29172 RepID=A0A0D8Y1D1_DICVI|nr:hypothetical protein DICVIV_03904 [Dictyocaulus viviparus]